MPYIRIFGVGVYIGTQTTNSQIYDMATDYLSICSVISMGIVFFSIFEKMLQATGLSLYSTVAQITGAVINIILDPIMIYGLFGLPQMGVKGCGICYGYRTNSILYCCACFHLKLNKSIKNGIKYMKPSIKK